jgi:hypothetical protein
MSNVELVVECLFMSVISPYIVAVNLPSGGTGELLFGKALDHFG